MAFENPLTRYRRSAIQAAKGGENGRRDMPDYDHG